MTDKTECTRRTVLKALGAAGASIARRRAGDRPTELAADHQDHPSIALGPAIQLAESEGLFAKEGLKAGVLSRPNPGGRQSPCSWSGQLDVTVINVGGLAAAVQHLPLKAVATGLSRLDRLRRMLRQDSPISPKKNLFRQDHCGCLSFAITCMRFIPGHLRIQKVVRERLAVLLVPVAETAGQALMAGNVEAAALIVSPFP